VHRPSCAHDRRNGTTSSSDGSACGWLLQPPQAFDRSERMRGTAHLLMALSHLEGGQVPCREFRRERVAQGDTLRPTSGPGGGEAVRTPIDGPGTRHRSRRRGAALVLGDGPPRDPHPIMCRGHDRLRRETRRARECRRRRDDASDALPRPGPSRVWWRCPDRLRRLRPDPRGDPGNVLGDHAVAGWRALRLAAH
jgi:hypothetical protein